MATKTIVTRIKNKVANLSSWQDSTGVLFDGEIAIVRVPTDKSYLNPVTGKTEPVVELLMKVGDGEHKFNEVDANGNPYLPWLSAKASDVYDWAKTPDAKDVKIKVVKGTDSTATESTLATWLKTAYDAGVTNATAIAGLNTTVTKLDGADTVDGSVRKLIKAAIEGLDAKTEQGSGNFVKAVTQVDGKIQVTKGTIAESELPNISASKIIVTPASSETQAVMLDTKLGSIDTDILNLKNRQVGHTDAQINTLIDNKLDDLKATDPTASGNAVSFIDTISQTDGKITATKKTIPGASASTAGITTLGANGGAATYASVFGTDGKGGINAQVETNKTDIATLKTAVAGGVHFRGTTTTKITDGSTTATISINGTNYTAKNGDVVIYQANNAGAEDREKEFIWVQPEGSTSGHWEVLGDLSRVATLETWRNKLVKDDAAVEHKFVTEVDIAADGTVTINRAQPTSADVSHDGGTVATKLAAHDTEVAKLSDIGTNAKVGATIDSKITTALDGLDFTSPSTTNATATEFIDTVSQENGQISATKKKLPTASTTVAGIVKLNDTVTSTSTSEAATAKAVKTAYDKADDAQTRVGAVEGNYVRYDDTDKKLYVGKSGTEEIIFDCGGAPV